MSIEVSTETLRGSVTALTQTSETVRAHQPDKRVAAVAGAVSGGASEQAVKALATAWKSAYAGWHRTAEEHRQALSDAADTHDATDQRAGRAFPGHHSPRGGPVP